MASQPHEASQAQDVPRPPEACEPHVERVLLLGGCVRTAAQSACRGGFAVVAADRFCDTDTLAACERHLRIGSHDDLVATLDRVPSMPTVIVGGLEGAADLVRQISRRHPILGPSWETHLGLRDPDRLRDLADGSGLSVPEFRRVEGPTDVHPTGPGWLWKRLDSSGGLGVTWAGGEDDPPGPSVNAAPGLLEEGGSLEKYGAMEKGRRREKTTGYFQRRVEGRPLGATYLGDGETARLLGVFRQSFVRRGGGRLPFVFAGAFGPVAVSPATTERLRNFGSVITQAFGLRGLFNVDVIAGTAGELWLLEVNPRWSGTSDLVELMLGEVSSRDVSSGDVSSAGGALGAGGERTVADESRRGSLFRTHWEFLRGRRHDGDDRAFENEWRYAGDRWWKRVAFSNREGRFSRRRLEAATAACPLDIRIGDIPADGYPVASGEPIVSVTCKLAALPTIPLRRLMAALQDTILTEATPCLTEASP